ncbi:urease accessory protein UreD [Methylobacterium sp. 092160098-2]|uniref:urease accessory protein UreD n=1 Tax=Methylobacterium sp. 092160098-2 TaxID=3025129 RepID=UPI002381C691|nr:urease accessory protein UreD [Methylobacterium sp. 092160098-2]MDE4912776.1 urease accessory protein UreD [Methylobacterium sp. 092160098-2]
MDHRLPTSSCPPAATGAPPARQRSDGRVRLRVGPTHLGGATRILDLAESGPSRLRFPRGTGALETVLVNTAGGVACGDTFAIDLALDPGAELVLTTTAAEKIYRSDGPVSHIANTLALEAGAHLAWLPQETILFDRARVRRRFTADLAEGAALIAVEVVAFGRAARGERITDGLFADSWRIRRGGRLAYADDLLLDGPISDLLARPAVGGGARACATVLDIAPGAEARLEEARALLAGAAAPGTAAAASAWNGHLAIRALGEAVGPLRGLIARFVAQYRGVAMPRVWQS